MKLEFYRQVFEKYSKIKFHEYPSSGNRVVPCGRTERQTDTTKLIAAFRNFANAPTNDTGNKSDIPHADWLERYTISDTKKKDIKVQ
jgi:hypothetical protein